MNNAPKFFTEALRGLKQTGSFIPSSKSLTEKMTQYIDFTQSLKIVELGAGEGVFTRSILSKMSQNSQLYSIEINPILFSEIEKIEDSRLQPILGSVLDISNFLTDNSIDLIISGISLANMNKKLRQELLHTCNIVLKPGKTFVQFQYSLNAYRLIKTVFGEVCLDFTPWNIPPAFVYCATKCI